MGGIPEFRLVIQLRKDVLRRRAQTKDGLSGEFLVEAPKEFVHVHVGVCGGWTGRERDAGLRTLLIHDLLEASEVGGIAGAHGSAFVAGDQSLHLNGDQAGHAVGLIARDETADGLGGGGTAAQVVVVLIQVVAAGVGGVGLPVIGGPTIASPASERKVRRSAGDSVVDAVDVRRNRMGLRGVDRHGDVRRRRGGRGAAR